MASKKNNRLKGYVRVKTNKPKGTTNMTGFAGLLGLVMAFTKAAVEIGGSIDADKEKCLPAATDDLQLNEQTGMYEPKQKIK